MCKMGGCQAPRRPFGEDLWNRCPANRRGCYQQNQEKIWFGGFSTVNYGKQSRYERQSFRGHEQNNKKQARKTIELWKTIRKDTHSV